MFTLDEVIPSLFVSDALAASSLTTLRHYKITHILVAGEELTLHFSEQFTYKQLPVVDNMDFDISSFFPESNQFIELALRTKGHVLIHCAMGISRSVTLATAYVMQTSRLSYDKAIRLVKDKHKSSRPNPGFKAQLQAYEKESGDPRELCCCLI
jgi:protein-tyrosine phosphatase